MEPINVDETKPAIEPIRRVKLYEEVAARIRDLIADGGLRPGQALPSERKLAEKFKVGRAVIREAIRQLEVSGLVESRHGGGNYVREVTVEHLVAPIVSVLNGMSHLREELMDARLFFEPQVARAAAARATPEDLRLLEDVIRRQEEHATNGRSGAEEDAEFHELLARATHNTVVERVMEVIDNLLEDSQARLFRSVQRSRISLEGNRRILEAVRNHDQEAAQKAMVEHLEDIARHL
jgi:GntR family transcriptional regulator, transcriptional repressor for pyruvate dehydrogenase complex